MQTEYVILVNNNTMIGEMMVKKSFKTLDEAFSHAETLTFPVIIYQAIAQTKIKHEIVKINENPNNPTSKSPRVPKSRSRLAS